MVQYMYNRGVAVMSKMICNNDALLAELLKIQYISEIWQNEYEEWLEQVERD